MTNSLHSIDVNVAESKSTGRLPRKRRFVSPWWIATLLCASYLLAFMQRTGPGVIGGTLQSQFHVSAATLGTLTSIQYLLYMLLQVPVGLSGDKYGPERLLCAGVLMDGLGTLVFSVAHNYPTLLFGRAVVGLGDALIWINIVIILSRWFSARVFGSLLAVVSTSGSAGALLTTIPFAAWTAAEGWRIPFSMLGMLLVVVSIGIFISMRKGPPVSEGTQQDAVHVQKVPIRDTLGKVVRDRNAWATCACHFSAVGTYIGFVGLWAVPYFMDTYHVSSTKATVFTLVAFIGALVGGPIAGAVSDLLHTRRLPYIVSQVLTTLAWAIVPICGGKPPLVLAYLLMFIVGFGSGVSLLTFAVVRDQTPVERTGVTSGFANTGGFLSAVILPVLYGTVLDSAQGHHSAGTPASVISEHTFALAFLVPTLFSCIGIFGAIFIRERGRVNQTPPSPHMESI